MTKLKPWYLFRPSQILRRLDIQRHADRFGWGLVTTAWGAELSCDTSQPVGHSILTTGIHELPVTEAMCRLIKPGDTVLDVGANVGYTSILAAKLTGPAGTVVGFEPQPTMAKVLRSNLIRPANTLSACHTVIRQAALGSEISQGTLFIPKGASPIDGEASMIPRENSEAVAVDVSTLDVEVEQFGVVSLAKIDVEGFEIEVLKGASKSLAEGRITTIIFEDHNIAESKVVQLLNSCGYHIFALDWKLFGPVADSNLMRNKRTTEAPNFAATKDPNTILSAMKRRGWRALRRI